MQRISQCAITTIQYILQVFWNQEIRGNAVRTTQDLEKHQFVIEYDGKLLKHKEALKQKEVYERAGPGVVTQYMFDFDFDGKLWW